MWLNLRVAGAEMLRMVSAVKVSGGVVGRCSAANLSFCIGYAKTQLLCRVHHRMLFLPAYTAITITANIVLTVERATTWAIGNAMAGSKALVGRTCVCESRSLRRERGEGTSRGT